MLVAANAAVSLGASKIAPNYPIGGFDSAAINQCLLMVSYLSNLFLPALPNLSYSLFQGGVRIVASVVLASGMRL